MGAEVVEHDAARDLALRDTVLRVAVAVADELIRDLIGHRVEVHGQPSRTICNGTPAFSACAFAAR